MRYWSGMVLGLCLSGAAAAQTPPPIAPTAPTAPTAHDGRKSIQLSKLYFDSQNAQTKGKMRTGLWCISHGPWKWNNPSRVLIHNDQFDFRFTREMALAGYRAVSPVQDMFNNSSDSDIGANYLIGATLVPDTDDLCFSVDGVKGTVAFNIEFKIYDTAAKAVVDTIPVSGQAHFEKFSNKGQGGLEIEAFVNAVDNLITSGGLTKYLGAPKPLPVAAAPIAGAPIAPEAPAANTASQPTPAKADPGKPAATAVPPAPPAK